MKQVPVWFVLAVATITFALGVMISARGTHKLNVELTKVRAELTAEQEAHAEDNRRSISDIERAITTINESNVLLAKDTELFKSYEASMKECRLELNRAAKVTTDCVAELKTRTPAASVHLGPRYVCKNTDDGRVRCSDAEEYGR